MRVLHIVEAANPEWVSVPLVGWSHSEAISKITDNLIVTQIRNRGAFLRAGLKEEIDFESIDSELVAKPLDKLGEFLSGGKGAGWTTKMAVSYFSYLYFEHILWKKLRSRIKNGEFDIVHRITPLSPTQPSILAKKCKKYKIPFILGPLNGGLPWPKQFDKERRREKEWLSYIRNIYKILPGYKSTRDNATAIVIGSKATWEQIEEKYHDKCIYIPENAVDLTRFSKVRNKKAERKLKAIFVGRLVPYKGAHLLLHGFAEALKKDKVSLDIIGDGPDRDRLEDLVKELGISENVHFHGWVEHNKVGDYLVNSDFLAFPSIREFGGGVVLEAMALGVMPMVVNYGGPAELVDKDTGILIELSDESGIISSLKLSIDKIVKNPQSIDLLGKTSRELVLRKFTWEKKAEQMKKIYEWVLDPSTTKPKFF